MPKLPKVLILVLLMAGSANLGGCALSAATIVPAAVGGAPVVIDSLEADSSDTFWLAEFDAVLEAALRARAVLTLKLEDAEIEDDKAVLKFTDRQEDRITLHIERRTETVTRVRFVSGSSDIHGLTRLLGRQIIEELRLDGAFLADWASEEKSAQP